MMRLVRLALLPLQFLRLAIVMILAVLALGPIEAWKVAVDAWRDVNEPDPVAPPQLPKNVRRRRRGLPSEENPDLPVIVYDLRGKH